MRRWCTLQLPAEPKDSRGWQIAPDCAVLPCRDAVRIYQGATGRVYRVPARLGRWLAQGCPWGYTPAETAWQDLVRHGVLVRRTRWCLNVNTLAPHGAAGWGLAGLMAASGGAAWTAVLASALLDPAAWVPLFSRWTTWACYPLAALGLSLAHEWGHVMVLRLLGGRAGRIRLRWGWPWALAEVGPYRLLPFGQAAALVGGGMAVELIALGWALAALASGLAVPATAALAAAAAVHLLANLLPLPGSDGGQLMAILLHLWARRKEQTE